MIDENAFIWSDGCGTMQSVGCSLISYKKKIEFAFSQENNHTLNFQLIFYLENFYLVGNVSWILPNKKLFCKVDSIRIVI